MLKVQWMVERDFLGKYRSASDHAFEVMLCLDDLWSQTCDLAPTCSPKFVGHYTVDSCPQWLLLIVEQNACIIVKSNDSAVRSGHLLLCSYNDCVSYVSSSDFLCACLAWNIRNRSSFLYHDYNFISCSIQVGYEEDGQGQQGYAERGVWACEDQLTNTTKTLCGFVSQDIDTLCDEPSRVVDDRHARFETQHDVDVCGRRPPEDSGIVAAVGKVLTRRNDVFQKLQKSISSEPPNLPIESRKKGPTPI